MLARCYLAKGELERARQWMEQLDPGVFSNPLNLSSPVSAVPVFCATGEPVKAIEILAPLRMARNETGVTAIWWRFRWSRQRPARRRQTTRCPEAALGGHGESQICRLPAAVCGRGSGIREALRDMPQLAEPGAWNQNLRAILTGEPEPRQSDSGDSSGPASEDSSASDSTVADLIEPLSQRELEVLKLINEGLANKEIAQQMAVAPATVKAHIRNLYGKLDVRRRTEALARARDLGLLD